MRSRYLLSCAAAALLSSAAMSAAADEATSVAVVPTTSKVTATADAAADTTADTGAGTVAEIVVSAERRDETVQNVPATVQAYTAVALQDNNVLTLTDFLKFTPNVQFGTNGPGQGVIFMRGLSAGIQGGQSSATIATFPNTALYLDDQSMQFPGRNVDIYTVDLERVEILEGPQGTLFGGGAEAGAVRYITKKPDLDAFSGHAEGSFGDTSGGAANYAGNVTLNIPVVKDKFALRFVVYDDRQGGYIDNVASTFARSNLDPGNHYFGISSGSGNVCPNGLPTAGPNTFCVLPNTPTADNYGIAGRNTNPTTYTGARVSGLIQVNDDWNVLIQQSFQDLDAEGESVEYPVGSNFQPLGPLQGTFFNPAWERDNWENTSWTVNGKIGPLKAIYTGGYMDRHIDSAMDYTNYTRAGEGDYYTCTGPGSFGSLPEVCYSPLESWRDTVRSTHLTNELRFSTPDDWRLRGIMGVFQESFRIDDDMNFTYKTGPSCASPGALANIANVTCYGETGPLPGTTANDPSLRGPGVAFGEDTQRGYDQSAVFASLDYDIIPHVLTATLGTRWYDYNEFLVGSQYESTAGGCTDVQPCDLSAVDTNINAANDRISYKGFKSRANLTWHVTPDTMAYFTFSQGFRPGGFNRSVGAKVPYPVCNLPGGCTTDIEYSKGPNQFEKPNGYAPDSLDNYEIGFKTELLDHRVQINLSAYHMYWSNIELIYFNPAEVGNTSFGINGADYVVNGGEFQIVAKPTEQLTIWTSGSYNDDRQVTSPCFKSNIAASPTFGQCITEVYVAGLGKQPFADPLGSLGSTLPFSPKFQGEIRLRYDWNIAGDYKAHVQVGGQYQTSMFNQLSTYPNGNTSLCTPVPYTTLCRYQMPGFGTLDASIGVAKDKWSVELYGTNLADSHASVLTSSEQFIKSEVPIRPRVVGLRIASDF